MEEVVLHFVATNKVLPIFLKGPWCTYGFFCFLQLSHEWDFKPFCFSLTVCFLLFRASKAVLLQLVSLIPLHSQRDSLKRAESLWRALDGELDLSHSTLDQWTCSSLARLLDSSEGLTELDLSHCELTDQLLQTLIPELHKVQVLEWVSDHSLISSSLRGPLVIF